jgi:hypothetical protein
LNQYLEVHTNTAQLFVCLPSPPSSIVWFATACHESAWLSDVPKNSARAPVQSSHIGKLLIKSKGRKIDGILDLEAALVCCDVVGSGLAVPEG